MSNCITENRAGMIILDGGYLDGLTDDELAETFKNIFVTTSRRYMGDGMLPPPQYLKDTKEAIVIRGFSPLFEIVNEDKRHLGEDVPIYDIEIIKGGNSDQ